ncbi:MAG: hypothetical protein P4K97_07090 [Terracidiphilus sp.]|nr:hypothetical protein [Terracidiphilus sp.]
MRRISWALMSALFLAAAGAQDIKAKDTNEATGAPPPSVQIARLAPPNAPKVTCVGNKLTISANNSTVEGVLAAVRSCIGIKVDIPEGATGGRLFEDIGPGPARQVLESLLSGTDFDYVIGSSEEHPQDVNSVILLMRTTDTTANNIPLDRTLTPARRAWLQSRQNARPNAPPSDENSVAADDTTDSQAVNEPVSTPASSNSASGSQTPASEPAPSAAEAPVPSADNVPMPATAAQPASITPASASANQDKSTAERISDMQQMFEQRRLMNQTSNQNQNSASPNP